MALSNNASNRFGPSSYVVGTTLGDGCNFTLVGDAIAQAVADGHTTANPTTILVRAGNHAGTFTMAPGIYVVGVGNGSNAITNTIISGSIIIDATTAGGITYGLENLFITDGGTTITTINAGLVFLDIGNCSIFGDTALTISNVSGTFSQIVLRDCNLNGITTGISLEQHNLLRLDNCDVDGGTTGIAVRDTARIVVDGSRISGTTTYGFEITGGTCRVDCRYSTITSTQEAIIGPNVGEIVFMAHCTVDSSAVSGNFIDNVNIFEFYDVALTGSALLNNAIATQFIDWQPHAGTAGNATLPGGVRGTSCFDNAAFTVTNGFVELIGGVSAGSFPVDNGGPGVPLLGAMSFLGSTSVDFPIASGIETHVGATTNEIYFEDRRWVSPLIVDADATVGIRGTFTTITAALAVALPQQTVYVRPGVYAESFTLVDQVQLIGLTTPGGNRFGLGSVGVIVTGTVTSPPAGASCEIQNMRIIGAGPAIMANASGSIVRIYGCTLASAVAAIDLSDGQVFLESCYVTGGSSAIDYNTNGGTYFEANNCTIDANNNVVDLATDSQFVCNNSNLVSFGGGGIFSTSACIITVTNSKITTLGAACLDMQVDGTADISFSTLSSPIQTINFNAVAPLVRSFHNTHICTGAASEYVVGPGKYEYADDVVRPITFAGIDGAASQTIYGWRPWAQVVTAPGTNSNKGVASFDDVQFTSTDGFIQLSGGNSPPFTDVSGVLSAVRNNGYYATAATTFTLDSLAIQGDLVIIYADTAAAVVVTANAGQQIRLGSSISAVAGTLTSTAIGDSITLRFRASTSVWETVSVLGNWSIV